MSLSRRRPNWVSDPVILSQRPSRSRAQGKGGRHVNRAFGDSARRSTHIAYSADLLRLTRLNSIEPGYCTCAHMKYRPRFCLVRFLLKNRRESRRWSVFCAHRSPEIGWRRRRARGERGTHQNVGGSSMRAWGAPWGAPWGARVSPARTGHRGGTRERGVGGAPGGRCYILTVGTAGTPCPRRREDGPVRQPRDRGMRCVDGAVSLLVPTTRPVAGDTPHALGGIWLYAPFHHE